MEILFNGKPLLCTSFMVGMVDGIPAITIDGYQDKSFVVTEDGECILTENNESIGA